MEFSELNLFEYRERKGKLSEIIKEIEEKKYVKMITKTYHFNITKDFSNIQLLLDEFEIILLNEDMTPKEYTYKLGFLDGQISTIISGIQIIANEDIIIYSEIQNLMIAKNNMFCYLKSLV